VLTPSATGPGPFTWSATGLPTGYTISSGTGAVSAPGNANNQGVYASRITVSNADGNDFEDFQWTITTSDPTLGSAIADQTHSTGQAPALSLADHFVGATQYFADVLPDGITLNQGSGVFGGTFQNEGTTTTTAEGRNAYGSVFDTFNWIVDNALSPPTLTGPIPDQTVLKGTPITALNMATYFSGATSYVADAVPAGITFSGGIFSGTPTGTPGVTTTTVDAINVDGEVSDTFTWTVNAVPELIAPIPDANVYNGQVINGEASNWFRYATSYSSTPFPATITMNAAGTITGTYTAGAASGTVTITATNASGSVQDTFAWTGTVSAPEGGAAGHGLNFSISLSL
jgi:hypothetical protein